MEWRIFEQSFQEAEKKRGQWQKIGRSGGRMVDKRIKGEERKPGKVQKREKVVRTRGR